MLVFIAPIAAASGLIYLYDGSLGRTPDQQGYFVYQAVAIPPPVQATQTLTIGGVILDTTPITTDYAGYYSPVGILPTLNRTTGYTLCFTTQVLSENHLNNDRAGFSFIILSSDSIGLELGFWENEIWAQEGGSSQLFTHAEGITFTTTSLVSYQLAVISNTYRLATSGTPILSGSLRNYSAFGAPYTSTNFLFLGDNTSSARAKIKLTEVFIATGPGCNSLFLPIIIKTP